MKYIIKAYTYANAKRILKDWQGNSPVFITQYQYDRTREQVKEYRSQLDALEDVNRIKAAERWRHYDIEAII